MHARPNRGPGSLWRVLALALLTALALPAMAAEADPSAGWPNAPQPAPLPTIVTLPLAPRNLLAPAAWEHPQYHWWTYSAYYERRPGQLFPELQLDRRTSSDVESGLLELRWRMGAKRSTIPVLEVAGCDIVSPEQFRQRHDLSADARPGSLLARTRHAVTQAISSVVAKGCN